MNDLEFTHIFVILIACPTAIIFSAEENRNNKYNKFPPAAEKIPCLISEKNSVYPWYLPEDHNKEIAPWYFRHLTNLPLPWFLFFEYLIFDIQEINDKK